MSGRTALMQQLLFIACELHVLWRCNLVRQRWDAEEFGVVRKYLKVCLTLFVNQSPSEQAT